MGKFDELLESDSKELSMGSSDTESASEGSLGESSGKYLWKDRSAFDKWRLDDTSLENLLGSETFSKRLGEVTDEDLALTESQIKAKISCPFGIKEVVFRERLFSEVWKCLESGKRLMGFWQKFYADKQSWYLRVRDKYFCLWLCYGRGERPDVLGRYEKAFESQLEDLMGHKFFEKDKRTGEVQFDKDIAKFMWEAYKYVKDRTHGKSSTDVARGKKSLTDEQREAIDKAQRVIKMQKELEVLPASSFSKDEEK